MMSEITFQKGAVFPEHIHFTDHSGYCMQGKIRIIKNGIVQDFIKGDSWCIGKNICHSTEAIEESMVIELFKADDEIF
jgi:quercetin dioxygenase-like cupin family protein